MPESNKSRWLVIVILILVLLAGAAGYYYFTRNNPPSDQLSDTGTPQMTDQLQPSPTPQISVNFSQEGNLVKDNPGLKADTWYLVYEKPGTAALNIELIFIDQSECKIVKSSAACSLDDLEKGERVKIDGSAQANQLTVKTVYRDRLVLSLEFGPNKTEMTTLEFAQGMTVFDLLKEGAKKLGLAIKTQTYEAGAFVQKIGDTENGKDGNYWIYYVNGQPAQAAPDKVELNAGDAVDWRFEKASF